MIPRRTAPDGSLDLRLWGERVTLLPDRAALWNDVLLVADIHLGKGDHFRARGLPLPPGELEDDLARLTQLVATTGARRVRVLGDLIHGRVGPATEAQVADWAAELPATLELVPGNHDRHERSLPGTWGVHLLDAVTTEGPFTFAHAPANVGAFVWAGHVHPTAVLRGPSERMRFPAFILTESLGLLPAFSRFTGGPVVREAEGMRRYVCVEDEVVSLDE